MSLRSKSKKQKQDTFDFRKDMYSRLGKLLATLRMKAALTQQNVSDGIGVSLETISAWECGRSAIAPQNWAALGQILKVDPEVFLECHIESTRERLQKDFVALCDFPDNLFKVG